MDYILPQIPRLHTAIAEWCSCIIFIYTFRKNMHKSKRVLFCLFALFVQCLYQIFAGYLPLEFWVFGMAAAIGLMYLWIYRLGNFSKLDAAYICVRAFVLAEFAASFEWQTYCFYVYTYKGHASRIKETGIMIIMFLVIFSLAYLLEQRFYIKERNFNIHIREFTSALIIGLVAFTMSNSSFIYTRSLFSARYDAEIYIIRTIMDFGGLAVLYNHYILGAELQAQRELDAIRNVLQRQYSQYKLFKENNEQMNMKYHDLKHQIDVIRDEKNVEIREKYLSDMEEHLSIYDSQNHTGNQVLDTLLTSKRLECNRLEIELTCVVNGSLLEHLDAMDICTIFGNALDNAIECEKKIEDKKKRMIHVAVFSKNNFLMIRIENYFEGSLHNVIEGLPSTTKSDKLYHGYGLKSIRYTAKNYGGTVTVGTHNDWFELKILIPMRSKENLS